MENKYILWTIVVLIALLLVVFTFFPGIIFNNHSEENSNSDKCSPGPGYTEESWKEHMSHHPGLYKECL